VSGGPWAAPGNTTWGAGDDDTPPEAAWVTVPPLLACARNADRSGPDDPDCPADVGGVAAVVVVLSDVTPPAGTVVVDG
jgi:hypothetical protein